MIQRGYKVNFMIDNLPAIYNKTMLDDTFKIDIGFPLGFEEDDELYINNHVRFYINYTMKVVNDEKIYKVVGFHIEPFRYLTWLNYLLSSVSYDNNTFQKALCIDDLYQDDLRPEMLPEALHKGE